MEELILIVFLGVAAAFALVAVAGIIWSVIWAIINFTKKRLFRTVDATSTSPEAPELDPSEVPARPPRPSHPQVQHEQQQQHRGQELGHVSQSVEPAIGNAVRDRHQEAETEWREITTLEVVNELQQRLRLSANAEPDYPPYFLSPQRETSLPGIAMKLHIFVPGNLTLDSIVEGALRMSEKREQDIFENTVFCAPEKWITWSTKRGPRIVSSERVVTVQCEREGGRGNFFVAWVDMKYAIFRNNERGHLMCNESLQS